MCEPGSWKGMVYVTVSLDASVMIEDAVDETQARAMACKQIDASLTKLFRDNGTPAHVDAAAALSTEEYDEQGQPLGWGE